MTHIITALLAAVVALYAGHAAVWTFRVRAQIDRITVAGKLRVYTYPGKDRTQVRIEFMPDGEIRGTTIADIAIPAAIPHRLAQAIIMRVLARGASITALESADHGLYRAPDGWTPFVFYAVTPRSKAAQ